jgi:toxin-antitoxin system PIN domain toxin
VILIDANLLLYAYHPRAEQHEESRAWLEVVLSGPDLVRFAWLTLWAFLRIATNPRVFERPLSTSEAEAAISSWLDQPAAGILDPGERHWDIAQSCARRTGCRPAGHGRRPRRDRARTWRYSLHNGSRLLAVFRA